MKLGVQVTGASDVRAELLRIGSLPARALAITAEEVEVGVEEAAGKHHKTGAAKLVQSVFKQKTPEGWLIGHDPQVSPVAKWVHWGTRPHEIRAKNKQALRYVKDGIFWFWFGPKSKQEQAVIRKWVKEKSSARSRVMFRWPKHPGYMGDPWMVRQAALAPITFDLALRRLMNKEA